MSSMPKAEQPWRPGTGQKKPKPGSNTNEQQQQQGGNNMGSANDSTSSGGGGQGSRGTSFETDDQISHRTHKFNHNPHAFQKYQDPQPNQGGGGKHSKANQRNQQQQQGPSVAVPVPNSAQQAAQLQQQQAAAAAAAAQKESFNLEDALDAFGNIREHQFVQRATEWLPVADSGVTFNPCHNSTKTFNKLVAEACKQH